jgi:hypothetical protein
MAVLVLPIAVGPISTIKEFDGVLKAIFGINKA